MPTLIRDPQLLSYYRKMRDEKLHDQTTLKLKASDLPEILSTVGDSATVSAEKMLQLLTATGGDRQTMFDLVKDNVDVVEKADLEAWLDTPPTKGLEVDREVRNFIAALVNREPLDLFISADPEPTDTGTDQLKVIGDSRDGRLKIKTTPGAMVLGFDGSETADLRWRVSEKFEDNDWVTLGVADANGDLTVALGGPKMRGKQGDAVRLGAVATDGTKTVLDIRIKRGLEDVDNAKIATRRLQLIANGDGTISLSSSDPGRATSERGAVLYFVNTRTNQGKQIKLDVNGQLPEGATLSGAKDDTFFLAISDGVNNKNLNEFLTEGGQKLQLKVVGIGEPGNGGNHTIEEPTLNSSELDPVTKKPKFELKKFKGELGPVDPNMAVQGHLADCYIPSAFSSLAVHQPQALERAIEIARDPATGEVIKDADGDTMYMAHFFSKDYRTGQYTKIDVGPMTSQLWARSDGSPIYMRQGMSGTGNDIESMPLRFCLLEKALAIWKGKNSYEGIGNGGMASEVYQIILGRDGFADYISNPQMLKKYIEFAESKQLPWSLGTADEGDGIDYVGTGVYADHSYSGITLTQGTPTDPAVGLGGTPGGTVDMLELRNPWGEATPTPDLGSGRFLVTPEAGAKYFTSFHSVR